MNSKDFNDGIGLGAVLTVVCEITVVFLIGIGIAIGLRF